MRCSYCNIPPNICIYNLSEIYISFFKYSNDENCPQLTGKLKIYIINICPESKKLDSPGLWYHSCYCEL